MCLVMVTFIQDVDRGFRGAEDRVHKAVPAGWTHTQHCRQPVSPREQRRPFGCIFLRIGKVVEWQGLRGNLNAFEGPC